jgi:UDP-N-acetylmuramoyl-tripeptide--D-alanyl-D-alanine ligase
MLELGPDATAFHEEIGAHAAETADLLVTVGPLAAHMAGGFDQSRHHHAGDAAEAAQLVPQLLHADDIVLVKGSRGVALEQVCQAISVAEVA